MKVQYLMAAASVALLAGGFSTGASAADIKLGFSIDDLRVERWAKDRDYFIAAAKEAGAEVNVQSADANEQRQVSQIENMISRGVKTVAIVPFNSKVLGNIIADAKKAGIKVLSYDRLILNADVDAYITFDNERVGEMQAQGVIAKVAKGNFYLLGGAPTDNNAKFLREGQMKILKPLVDKGDIKIIGDQWVNDWLPANALSICENMLTAAKNDVQAVVASNDGTAGGCIQALAAQGLAGKVAISGQDADVAALKRIIDGTQSVTVYKPLKQIASEAAKLSIALAKGEKVAFTTQLDNGLKKVDTILLTPTILNKDNVDLPIKDGQYTKEAVYGK